MSMNIRCEACGVVFTVNAPEKTDDYNMILWKEQHRACPKCNQMPPGAITRPVHERLPFDDDKKIQDTQEVKVDTRGSMRLIDID